MKNEIYCSVDIESDGPVPGVNSMLSFATAAFTIDKKIVGKFSRNLELLAGAKENSDTMAFWNKTESNKKAYQETRKNLVLPELAMFDYADFLKGLPGNPIFVGYPAVFDFKWIDYYSNVFAGKNPFGFSTAIDMKTFMWAMVGGEFKKVVKSNMPKNWFDNLPHTHLAIDDCLEQGAMFINILRQHKELEPIVGIIED
jgi:hypothetical protein